MIGNFVLSYFIASQRLEAGRECVLEDGEARHILLSRRTKTGEQIELQDADHNRFTGVVVEVKKDRLKVRVVAPVKAPAELLLKVFLFQAFVSEKALDTILQKATELGAYKVVLFNSANVAAKLTAEQFQKKLSRWEKICLEAAKQSGRAFTPRLDYLPRPAEAAKEASALDRFLVLDASGGGFLLAAPKPATLGLVVGPEGGLVSEELGLFASFPNCRVVKLSSFTLRSETAAISALALAGNL